MLILDIMFAFSILRHVFKSVLHLSFLLKENTKGTYFCTPPKTSYMTEDRLLVYLNKVHSLHLHYTT